MKRWDRKAIDNRTEKQILTGMIVSDKFLSQVIPMYQPDFLQTSYGPTVASWCLEYWQEYEKAPGATIQEMYEQKRRNGLDPDRADLIAKFLESLSSEFERQGTFNDQYVMDKTEVFFKERALANASIDIDAYVKSGQIVEAEEVIRGFHHVARSVENSKLLLGDAGELLEEEELEEPLLVIPGAVGKYIGPLYRDWLVSFAAPKKRGKTWWLGWLGLMGVVTSRLNVGLFSLEMSTQKMAWRMLRDLAGVTHKPGDRLWPVWDCLHNQDGSCEMEARQNTIEIVVNGKALRYKQAPEGYEPCSLCMGSRDFSPASWLEKRPTTSTAPYIKAARKAKTALKFSGGADMRIKTWFDASPEDIRSTLYNWEHLYGFIPDVIVVDYADALTSDRSYGQKRHEIDAVWKGLKGLAMEKHALVLTATHTNRDSERRWNLTGQDYAEDNRKGWHVDLMMSINQSTDEEEYQRWRLGKTDERHDNSGAGGSTCTILNQLDHGQVCLDSYWF